MTKFACMTSPEKKYQVFVSSTYEDLINVRSKVMEAILRTYHIPIGMEMFSASNEEQWTIISKTIQNSDYYLLIVGHRYGSITDEGISYTEKEFDYAKSIGVPVFAFLRREDAPTTPKERDINPENINAFREKVKNNAIVEFWNGETDLTKNVIIAFTKMIHGTPRPGWIRADKALSPEIGKEHTKLSKENRTLKQELEECKAKDFARLPNFKLYANNEESLTLELKKFGNRLLLDYIQPIPDNMYAVNLVTQTGSTPKEIKTPTHREKIFEYNSWIANNKEVVDQYNLKHERQLRIDKNSVEVIFEIENIGLRKANDLFVEITFPNEILLFDELPDKENIPRPENIPKHPYAHDLTNFGPLSSLSLINPLPKLKHSNIHSFKHTKNPTNFQVNYQSLAINIDTLLHTRKISISDPIFLVPLLTGTFTVNVKFMCEELYAPIENTFVIIVSENTVTYNSEI